MAESLVQFMQTLGAVKNQLDDSPMHVYQWGNTFVHFINLQIAQTFPPDFTQQLTLKYAHKGYRLIHVWEDLWYTKQSLVRSRISAICGRSQKIHARATTACRTDKSTAHDFLVQHHLQGPTGAYYKYALMYHNEPIALATFSKARIMYDGPVYYRSYELERFAGKSGYTITGGLGKLIKAFIDEVNPAHIMTYADADWGKGEGYAKIGFVQTGLSLPELFFVNPQTYERHYADKILRQHNEDELKAMGYLKAFTAGNFKYVLDRRSLK